MLLLQNFSKYADLYENNKTYGKLTDMPSRQLIHIETDLLTKSINFSITSKTLPNKDIIATVEDVAKDLEKEEADTIRAKIPKLLRITSQG